MRQPNETFECCLNFYSKFKKKSDKTAVYKYGCEKNKYEICICTKKKKKS